MASYAKDWKSPQERSETKREASNKAAAKQVGKESAKAPPNTTGKSMKNSPDSKGPGPNDWKKGATKTPKGC